MIKLHILKVLSTEINVCNEDTNCRLNQEISKSSKVSEYKTDVKSRVISIY